MFYIKLFIEQIKLSFMSAMIFRANFSLMLIQGFINSIMGILSIEFIYLHVDSIAGWSKSELLILWCSYTIINQLCRGFINPNHWKFIQSVANGGFDRMVMRPVSLFFQINTGRLDLSSLFTIALPVVVLIIQLAMPENKFTFSSVVLYVLFILNGLLILSSFMMLLYSTVFRFIKVGSLGEVYYTLMNMAERPKEIFSRKALIYSLFLLIPAIPIANTPTLLLIGKGSLSDALLALGSGVMFFILSRVAIKAGVKNYSSASS